MADEENEQQENEEVEENEEQEEEDEERTGPVSAEEAERIRKALKKANDEAKRYRLEAKELKEKTESDQERALREAREEGGAQWRTRFLKAEAKVALRDAGLNGKTSKLVNLIDFDEVEIDDDGDIEGLEDQVTALKEDFPELFKDEDSEEDEGKKVRYRVDAQDAKPSKKKMSSAEKIASRL